MILKPNLISPLTQLYKNKHVLITGGGTGLGKQIASTYYDLGANITIASRKKNVLQKTKNELYDENKGIVDFKILDLKNHDTILELCNNFKDNNNVPDIIINNSAANFLCPSEKLTYNGWNTIIDTVLKGTLDLTLELGKLVIETNNKSVFVNISTTYAQTGSAFVLPSAISKAGIDNMTKSLAAEWGHYGIRMLSIAPGPIYTKGAFDRLDPTGQFQKQLINTLPMGRLGEKEELSNFISFLTTEQCNWLTGQIINFDGGEVVRNSGEFNSLLNLSKDDWRKINKLTNKQ